LIHPEKVSRDLERTLGIAIALNNPVQNSPTKNARLEMADAAATVVRDDKLITLPRWVVYFQAALLGLIATTFFVFGLMVGSLTSGTEAETGATFDVQVTGAVVWDHGTGWVADEGAVLFLLPRTGKPLERAAGNSVAPDSFEPLNNPGVAIVNRLGGAVVRTDTTGKFDILIDGSESGIDYFVLVVSRNQIEKKPHSLTKQQLAAIGTYFVPVESVINDRAMYWSTLKASKEKIDLGTIKF